jgi:simple sugar transport system ATP-binding protein
MSLLKLEGIGKNYFGNQVLQGVSIEIKPGEIHGLVGENGAGKSTLMNILFGMNVIHSTGGYEGNIWIDGEEFSPKTPLEAMERGIGMVHQEFMLIPGFTITENVKLNRENTKANPISKILGKSLEFLDFDNMEKDTIESLNKLNIDMDHKQKVEGLPVGYMQFVEIAREIDKDNLKLLILDEPTAVLTETEAADFLRIIKKLSELGIAVLFITHRLDEIKEITDNITVLRDGQMVASLKTKDVTPVEIAALMVGRDVNVKQTDKRSFEEEAPVALKIENLRVSMPGELVKGIDLEIKKGEIFGIGGLAGQGKIGVANGIMGLYETSGKIYKDGVEMKNNDPKSMLDNNVAFLSEDRKGVGLLLDEPIDLNIAYTAMESRGRFFNKVGPLTLVDKADVLKNAEEMIELLDIRCRGPKQHTRALSGGNQQKVCIARALTFEPEILLISEPTRGIDVGAKELVMDTLVKLNKEKHLTIIITSSELAELKQISDRIAIVSEGKLNGIFTPDTDDAIFGLAMSGEDIKEVANG